LPELERQAVEWFSARLSLMLNFLRGSHTGFSPKSAANACYRLTQVSPISHIAYLPERGARELFHILVVSRGFYFEYDNHVFKFHQYIIPPVAAFTVGANGGTVQ